MTYRDEATAWQAAEVGSLQAEVTRLQKENGELRRRLAVVTAFAEFCDASWLPWIDRGPFWWWREVQRLLKREEVRWYSPRFRACPGCGGEDWTSEPIHIDPVTCRWEHSRCREVAGS